MNIYLLSVTPQVVHLYKKTHCITGLKYLGKTNAKNLYCYTYKHKNNVTLGNKYKELLQGITNYA